MPTTHTRRALIAAAAAVPVAAATLPAVLLVPMTPSCSTSAAGSITPSKTGYV
jgi:hypothetical protein